MKFNMNNYYAAFRADYMKHGCGGLSWKETFAIMGYKSYRYTGGTWHYLSKEEFVIFVLRYSA